MYSTTTNTNNTSYLPPNNSPSSHNAVSPRGTSPAVSPQPRPDWPRESDHCREVLREFHHEVVGLSSHAPDFPTVLVLCQRFKHNEHYLQQALHRTDLTSELNLLRDQLPKFFKQINYCLTRQADNPLSGKSLETLCMGLSTLAHPLAGSLLTPAQREHSRSALTSISSRLATQLDKQLTNSYADTGVMLNCLNWFSRGLKAGLIQKDQPAIHQVFQTSLEQMQVWSAGTSEPANLNNRQLGKCMVQLNTMIKQHLVSVDPKQTADAANRKMWAQTVENLCRHFLSNDRWLRECDLVGLINITNTLKDGLEQGLLSANTLKPALDWLAERITAQEFNLYDPGSVTGLANCANFMRCLFELGLLGQPESATGQAILHLVRQCTNDGLLASTNSASAQQLVNLASFIKATDRWLVGTTDKDGSHAVLSDATSNLIRALYKFSSSGETQWLHSPLISSGLLAAIQYLWQRGLIPPRHGMQVGAILTQLLLQIPHWEQGGRNTQSTLQSLRALVALTRRGRSVDGLEQSDAFGQALGTLLVQLQQSKLAKYSAKERLAILQAVHIGVVLGAVSLPALQPLLQSLLETNDAVDLPQIEAAIHNLNKSEKQFEALSAEALRSAAMTNSATMEANQVKQSKPRGETYRGPAPQPTRQERIVDARNVYASYDWKTVDKGIKSPLPLEETPLPLPFTVMSSSVPKLAERSSEQKTAGQNKGNKEKETSATIRQTAMMTSMQISRGEKAQPAQIKPTPIKATHQVRSLKEAQARWVNLLEAMSATSLEELKKLTEAYPQLLNMKVPGRQKQTVLFYALTQGKREIVEWLMQHEQFALPESLGKFLITAVNAIETLQKRHIAAVRLFVDAYIKKALSDQTLSKKQIINTKNKLLTAEEKAELIPFPELESLFEETKLITKEDRNAGTLAITVKLMMEISGTKKIINIEKNSSLSKLDNALTSGDLKNVKIALKEIENLTDLKEAYIVSAWFLLMHSSYFSDTEIVQALLDITENKDALVKTQNQKGWTALNAAADMGYINIVNVILKEVSNKHELLRIQNDSGFTALSSAAFRGHDKIVIAILNTIKEKDAILEIKNNEGWTALSLAAAEGHDKVVNAILSAVKDKDALAQIQNKEGWTALSAAADKGHAHVVAMILAAVNNQDDLARIQNKHGWTALSVAASGHLDVINEILNAVKDKDALARIKDKRGWTALSGAADSGHENIVSAILNAVKDKIALLNIQNKYGQTALSQAAVSDKYNLVIAIINAIKDEVMPNGNQDIKGLTILQYLASSDGKQKIRGLIGTVENNYLTYMNKEDKRLTLLSSAEEDIYKNILITLLNEATRTNALAKKQDIYGWTTLMYATNLGDIKKVIEILNSVEAKDQLAHIQDNDGWTALMNAASKGNTAIANLILCAVKDKDALLRKQKNDGLTALDIAKINGHTETVDFLLNVVNNNSVLAQAEN